MLDELSLWDSQERRDAIRHYYKLLDKDPEGMETAHERFSRWQEQRDDMSSEEITNYETEIQDPASYAHAIWGVEHGIPSSYVDPASF